MYEGRSSAPTHVCSHRVHIAPAIVQYSFCWAAMPTETGCGCLQGAPYMQTQVQCSPSSRQDSSTTLPTSLGAPFMAPAPQWWCRTAPSPTIALVSSWRIGMCACAWTGTSVGESPHNSSRVKSAGERRPAVLAYCWSHCSRRVPLHLHQKQFPASEAVPCIRSSSLRLRLYSKETSALAMPVQNCSASDPTAQAARSCLADTCVGVGLPSNPHHAPQPPYDALLCPLLHNRAAWSVWPSQAEPPAPAISASDSRPERCASRLQGTLGEPSTSS